MKEEKEESLNFNDIMLDYMNKTFSDAEKKDGITSTVDESYFLSTGLLVFDLIMNGGIRSGWITTSGLEASGKTALAVKVLGSLAKNNIPAYFIDSEGSLDTDFMCSIAKIDDPTDFFGLEAAKGKGWIKQPKIRYTSENGLEKVFSFMQRILLSLPDKVYNKANNKWYLVFTKEKKSQEIMTALKLKHDAKLYTKTGKYYCEVENGNFQVVFIIDSLPGLVPEAIGEDADEQGNAMAFLARSFSKVAPAVRGLLRRKHAVLLPINQLREKPMAMFQDPEYEPCGNYIKFASDVRNRIYSRSVPDPFTKGKSPTGSDVSAYGEEPSVEGEGLDRYMYKVIKNVKNKRGAPFRQGWVRLWISDFNGKPRGFDPVFDCFKYLESTKQAELIKKAGHRYVIGLDKFMPIKESDQITWLDFKKLIIGLDTNNKELISSFNKDHNLDDDFEHTIYSKCFEQIKTGEAFNLLVSSNSNTSELENDVSNDFIQLNNDSDDFEDFE